MCYQCDEGMPHQCRKTGAYETGHGRFKRATYTEDSPALIGVEPQQQASLGDDDDADPSEPAIDTHRIRTTDGHQILAEPHMPAHGTPVPEHYWPA